MSKDLYNIGKLYGCDTFVDLNSYGLDTLSDEEKEQIIGRIESERSKKNVLEDLKVDEE